MKKRSIAQIIMTIIFVVFILSIVFITIRIFMAPSVASEDDSSVRVKGHYVLMLFQCIIGAFAMVLPKILKEKISLNIPSAMLIIFSLYLFCAIYLGEVQEFFYYRFPNYDTILHTFSGMSLGALGFSVISILNSSKSVSFSLTPLFVAVFAFCFAVSLSGLWEIYEFVVDITLKTNMQKYMLEDGTALVGQEALMDTMKDMIVDMIGALIMSAIGYFSLKYEKNWMEKLQLKRGG